MVAAKKTPVKKKPTKKTPVKKATSKVIPPERKEIAKAKLMTEVGQPGLMSSNSFINELRVKELSVPNCYFTYDQMVNTSPITEPLNLSTALQTNSIANGIYESSGTSRSQGIADYANYVIHNMRYMTFLEMVQNIHTSMKNGYSINEIVSQRATGGTYKGDLVLKHLGPRSPKSIKAFVWDKYKRRVTHIVQNPLQEADYKLSRSNASFVGNYSTSLMANITNKFGKHPIISTDKIAHSIYNGTFSNPQGNSPLNAAYASWQEWKVLAEYEGIGFARNFGGTPVATVPEQLLINANNPLDFPEDAASLREIEEDLSAAHAGRQTSFILPDTLVEGSTTMRQWSIELLGIQGTSGQFDTSEVIRRKTTEIYNCFNAGHLILGQDGNTSSYSLAESGTTSHAVIMNRDLMNTANVLEKLIGQLLDAQGFEYDRRDLPKFKWKTLDQLSLDELGKFIMRTMGVGGMTEAMMENVLKWGNVNDEGIDLIDYTDSGDSKVGTSNGSSGQGPKGQQNSTTNNENKQRIKPLEYHSEDLGDKEAILDENDNLVQIVEKNP